MPQNKLNFNLPWNEQDNYTICVITPKVENLKLLKTKLGGEIVEGNIYALPSGKKWNENWQKIHKVIKQCNLADVRIAVISDEIEAKKIAASARGPVELDEIASCLWLGDALLENLIECHFQAIMDAKKEVVGYESFVRARMEDGSLADGSKIMDASFFLGIQHAIDKYLHHLAIETFVKYNLQGNLFINFTTGFIQIPAKYLEGLSESLRINGMNAARLVLDVSKSDHITNIEQVASVVDFCHSKGYKVALDDVKQMETLATVLAQTMPDYVKIDRALMQHLSRPIVLGKVKSIIALAHERGCKILAEGVEDENSYKRLVEMGADMFQGYYFAKPLPAEEIGKKSKKSAQG